MRIADFSSLAKQRIGFVEKQYPVLVLGLSEEPRQIFLRFPDVLADNGGEVDAVDIEVKFVCNGFCRLEFVGTVRSAEKKEPTLARVGSSARHSAALSDLITEL